MPAPRASSFADASAALARVDPTMRRMYQQHGPARFRPKPLADARFASLARAVAYQQLAGSAASAIWGRAVDAIEQAGHRVDPAGIMAVGEGSLRAAGLSGAKVATLTGLAEACIDGNVDLLGAGRRSDDEVIAQLTQVRGIGVWTAQMFLMTALHRVDVWPVGDLGVRNGFALAHRLDDLPTPKVLDALGDPYRPYRSVLAWWCWREVEATRAGG